MYLFFCVCAKCVVGDCEEALPILDMLVASKNFSLVGSFPSPLYSSALYLSRKV